MRNNIYGKIVDRYETPEQVTKRLREWVTTIANVCVDYDGYRTEDGLKSLIDDIRAMSLLALQDVSLHVEEDDA